MNTTFDSPSVPTWKRIKLQHLTAACGVVLAVAGVVSLGGAQPRQKAATGTHAYRSPIASRSADMDDYTYYLVGSEAELDSLVASAMGDDFLSGHTQIFIVRDQADEVAMAMTTMEQQLAQVEFGTTTRVVDLRNR